MLAIVAALFLSVGASAQMSGTHEHGHGTSTAKTPPSATQPAAPTDAKMTDAGNKSCPISGDPVSGKDFVVYNGVRYGLCCKGCEKQFLQDPNKYIQKLREKGEIK